MDWLNTIVLLKNDFCTILFKFCSRVGLLLEQTGIADDWDSGQIGRLWPLEFGELLLDGGYDGSGFALSRSLWNQGCHLQKVNSHEFISFDFLPLPHSPPRHTCLGPGPLAARISWPASWGWCPPTNSSSSVAAATKDSFHFRTLSIEIFFKTWYTHIQITSYLDMSHDNSFPDFVTPPPMWSRAGAGRGGGSSCRRWGPWKHNTRYCISRNIIN